LITVGPWDISYLITYEKRRKPNTRLFTDEHEPKSETSRKFWG